MKKNTWIPNRIIERNIYICKLKYLLSILCLFVLSCDSGSPTAPEIEGCTDESACNYDETATLDDESCTYAEENFDCDGECIVEVDECGECGGDNSTCSGCIDPIACNYNSDSLVDDSSCTYPEENYDCDGNCIIEIDCNDECGGTATLDCNGDCEGAAVEFCNENDFCVCVPFDDVNVIPPFESIYSPNQIINDCDNFNDEMTSQLDANNDWIELPDYNDSFVFYPSQNNNKIFISSPHSQQTMRYPNCIKEDHNRDLRTGVIARILHEYTGCSVIYKKYKSDDPNYHDNIPTCTQTDVFLDHVGELLPYKQKIYDYITTQNTDIKFVMDLHGWKQRTGDVDLGTGDGVTLESEIAKCLPELIEHILTERYNITYSENIYSGYVDETVIKFVHKHITDLIVDAAQFEIEYDYRQCDSEFTTMIYVLLEIISAANYLYDTY